MTKAYLAGPMTGYPQFNFPAFHAATKSLRGDGWEIVSPAEEDHKAGIGELAESSKDGDPNDVPQTWGEVLARDVILLTDTGINAIVFLPNWQKSRGARLEAQVGLLQKGFRFFLYHGSGYVQEVHRNWVARELYNETIGESA